MVAPSAYFTLNAQNMQAIEVSSGRLLPDCFGCRRDWVSVDTTCRKSAQSQCKNIFCHDRISFQRETCSLTRAGAVPP